MTQTIGNRLDDSENTMQASQLRNNSLTSGHRACQGCAEALGARVVLDVAHGVSKGKLAVVNATGCLEVFSCVSPESSWNVAWAHSLFGNAPAVASGVVLAMKRRYGSDFIVVAQGGDGGTTDIGFGSLSGMFDRNDDVLYVCYDNQAYMNTGVQRSSATPAYARTATTLPNAFFSGNPIGVGKNVPEIAMAHNVAYVATASVAYIKDLEDKVRKALTFKGAKYLHVNVPCPLGWGSKPEDSIKIARYGVESALLPVFEAEHGKIVSRMQFPSFRGVEDYLKPQRRFAHLFGKNAELLQEYRHIAQFNVEKYGLKA